jgi:hypothetical protein
MVEANIWGSFASIEFIYDIEQSQYGLLFDKEKFWQSPGFRELWDRNVPLESLSKQRREARFGWFNKPE